MAKKLDRKKVNFMISKELLVELNQLIPSGDRSDFVNRTIKEALTRYSRQKAFEEIDKNRKNWKLKMTTEEILKLKNHGRE